MSPSPADHDYSSVTEVPGTGITRQALAMLWTRYAFAAELCEGRDVLELACGSGQGLGHLAARARRVVGSDFTGVLAERARREYAPAVPIVRADAMHPPFAARSFDAVILFEALYYLPDVERFVDECRRLLRPGGLLVLCSVNPQWEDFNPSPFSHRYWPAGDLSRLLQSRGFQTTMFGAFPAAAASSADAFVSRLKRVAVGLGLMPKTMEGKRLLKRLFYGRLAQAPARIGPGMTEYHAPEPFDGSVPGRFKVFYAVGRLSGADR